LKAGQTMHVNIGGVGRPIRGHVQEKIDGYAFRRAKLVPKPPSNLTAYSPFDIAADGSFTASDLPVGSYHLHIDIGTIAERNGRPPLEYHFLDYVATAEVDFVVPPTNGQRSDEPFDLGEVKLSFLPHLETGQVTPDIVGHGADGSPLKLSDFHGRYVLLQVGALSWYSTSRHVDRLRETMDRFGDDPRFAMVAVKVDRASAPWPAPGLPGTRLDIDDPPRELPTEYSTSGSSLYLIDPQGRLIAMNFDAYDAYRLVDIALKKERL
jgi:hypothetical protein